MFNNDILAEVTRWHGMGVTPIPLVLHDKRAAIPWRHLTDVQVRLDVVKCWFTKPRNMGVLLTHGLTVVDFDNAPAYMRWRRDIRLDTYTVRTRRGYHVYLWLDTPFGKTAKMDGGEIKGNGYVVAPPSLHESGCQYRAICKSAICRVASIDDVGIEYTVAEREPPMPDPGPESDDTSVVNLIKSQIGIASYLSRITAVVRSGSHWVCQCPFHDDQHPSMLIVPGEGRCFCFNPHCIAHRPMDVIDVCARLMRLSNTEAIRFLSVEV